MNGMHLIKKSFLFSVIILLLTPNANASLVDTIMYSSFGKLLFIHLHLGLMHLLFLFRAMVDGTAVW
jgi:hypothetical protein